ncbi:MAG: hypothetical protein K0S98_1043 [Propionibacteriaceae bacterium]|nr:hypothetical protein [Propionibacteriaceae bacterium]
MRTMPAAASGNCLGSMIDGCRGQRILTTARLAVRLAAGKSSERMSCTKAHRPIDVDVTELGNVGH